MIFGFNRPKDPTSRPHYLSHFHLRTAPFTSSGGDAFYSDEPVRAQTLDMLQHLTQYSEELLLVCGAEGGGKSALIDQYLCRVEEHWQICKLDGRQVTAANEIFVALANCYGLQVDQLPPDQLLAVLQGRLGAIQQQFLPVLIIDDVDRLDDEALELVLHLSRLASEDGVLLRVVLTAALAFRERIAEPRFASINTPHIFELTPLDEHHNAAYILHRLRAAGLTGQNPLTSKQLKRIQRNSGGIPSAINRLAHEALEAQMAAERSGIPHPGTQRTLMRYGAATIALAATAVTVYQRLDGITEHVGSDPYAMEQSQYPSTLAGGQLPIVRLTEGSTRQQMSMMIMGGQTIQVSCAPGAVDLPPDYPAGDMPPLLRGLPSTSENEETGRLPVESSVGAIFAEEGAEGQSPIAPSPLSDHREMGEQSVPLPQQVLASAPLQNSPEQESVDIPPVISAEKELVDDPLVSPPQQVLAPETVLVPPQIDRISPAAVPASPDRQTLVLHGEGFVMGMTIAVSRAGKARILDVDEYRVIDSRQLAIDLITGREHTRWAVQVSTPAGERSNAFRFTVVAPQSAPEPSLPGEPHAALPPAPEVPNEVLPKVVSDTTLDAPRSEPASPPIPTARRALVEPVTTGGPAADQAPALPTTMAIATRPPTVKETVTPALPAQPVTAKREALGILGHDWVAQQPASHYTLQLVSGRDRSSIVSAAQRYLAAGPVALISTMRDGAPLFALVMGSYPSREAAVEAASVSGGKPWIRGFAGVQSQLEQPAGRATVGGSMAGGLHGPAWIWSQSPTQYALQLAAAGNRDTLEGLLKGLKGLPAVAIVRTERDGRPWYLLLGGNYRDRDSAQAAVAALPALLQRQGPWPRSYASVHDELSR